MARATLAAVPHGSFNQETSATASRSPVGCGDPPSGSSVTITWSTPSIEPGTERRGRAVAAGHEQRRGRLGGVPGALEPHLVDAAARAARAGRAPAGGPRRRSDLERARVAPGASLTFAATVRSGASPQLARRRRRSRRRRTSSAAASAAGTSRGMRHDGRRRRRARRRPVGLGPGGGQQRRLALDLGHDPRLQRRRRVDGLDRTWAAPAPPAPAASTSSRQAGQPARCSSKAARSASSSAPSR